MEPITLLEAATAISADVSGELTGTFSTVCTDTREGARDSLFFALRGEKSDGHRYVGQALSEGAVAAVVERAVPEAKGPLLIVRDALTALGDLAAWHRRKFELPIVGVTGSVGKTSTKEMIACAISDSYKTLVSSENFNNEIGVPKTLCALHSGHQAAVIEMGMRGTGQIARLADIAGPTIGVVTNVGVSHIALLGSREAIALAKAELLERLPKNGLAVMSADDDFAALLASRAPCAVVTCGIHNPATYQAETIGFSAEAHPSFTVSGVPFAVHAPGVHHIMNALFACAVAERLGAQLTDVAGGLQSFRAPTMRMEILELPNGITILNDAYNAAPDSVRAALETLSLLGSDRRRTVAVLGEMRELGEFSHVAHEAVADMAVKCGVQLLVTVGDPESGGEFASVIADGAASRIGANSVLRFADSASAAASIAGIARPGDIVLVKGSRALAMERIVAALKESHAN